MNRVEQVLILDIETVPAYPYWHDLDKAGQTLWQKKCSTLPHQDLPPEQCYHRQAGIYAEFGKVICIGLAYFRSQAEKLSFYTTCIQDDDERQILQTFYQVCEQFFTQGSHRFAGHNIREFDIPYLCRRMLIQNLSLPKALKNLQALKPWETPLIDTLQFWKFGDYKQYTSLNLLTYCLGLPSPKQQMDGSEVAYYYWHRQDLQSIARYCLQDVEAVARILLKLEGDKRDFAICHEEDISQFLKTRADGVCYP